MKINHKKFELLAPAGDLEKMKTAFAFGADAVYLGIPDFSLRVRINDFTPEGINEAIKYAHGLKKKVFVTINIFAHNDHLEKLPLHIKFLKDINVDGLIVSDPGVMETIKKVWPEAEIHLSTQANCTNWQAAKFWEKQGVRRIILGRELSLDEINEIRKKVSGIALEIFIHGAMCMAYSGRCFLSKFYNDRNANLGDCSQPCRWKYEVENSNIENNGVLLKTEPHKEIIELVEEEHGSYILNSKDLCLLKRMPELTEAGIDSFKIEGRAKSVYYLANVVGAYRRAIDLVSHKAYRITHNNAGIKTIKQNNKTTNIDKELKFLFEELEEKLFHRGYTEGFMFGNGKEAQNLDNSHDLPEWEFCGQVVGSKAKLQSRKSQMLIRVHNTMKVGDEIEILRPTYDIIKMKIKKMVDTKSGKEISEAHGGSSEDEVALEGLDDVPEYSVIRRKLN